LWELLLLLLLLLLALAFAYGRAGYAPQGVFLLFGVAFGVIFLSEPLSATFLVAALLVGAGIVLVNRPTK